MKRIGLISDTHGFLDESVFNHFEACNEVWHAGDIGDLSVAERLESYRSFRAVHGNIDGPAIRQLYPGILHWTCEEMNVLMMHIGGYPGRYAKEASLQLMHLKPKLFITGHSHILKVARDSSINCLHINPGAAGLQGWHKVRTIVRFSIDRDEIRDMEVIELHPRRPRAHEKT